MVTTYLLFDVSNYFIQAMGHRKFVSYYRFRAPQIYSFASVVYATAYLSVRPSVRHTPVLCQNEGTQRDAVFTVG